jgi:hypothetical protein
MPFLKRKRVLAAKIEAAVGTVETLAAADAAFNVYDPMIQCTLEMESRQGQGGFGMLPSVPAGRIGVATFRTMLEWDGTTTEPAWADTFLPACGYVKSGQVYTPRSEAPGSNVKTLTIGLYQDDGAGSTVFKRISGAMGSFTVNLPTGRPGFIEWTFTGVWQPPTAVTMITPTYPTVMPLRYAGGLAEWNNVNLCVESATINSGNTVIMRECPTTAAGYISAFITDRVPTVSINPEASTIAAQDRWAAWLASTEFALELDVAGPTNAVLSFDAPKAQIINSQEADREGMVTDDIEFQLNKNGATHDEELSITFTAAT